MAMNKSAYFFSVDALIGLLIVLGIILLIQPYSSSLSYQTRVQEDLLRVLSDINIGDLNNSYAQALIANGTITNVNNSVLDQLGVFYSVYDPAGNALAQDILDSLDLDVGVALYYDDTLLANNSVVNLSSATKVRSARFLVSGIMGGVNASSGFSSRAFLFSDNRVKYFYFGGYVGDGNITVDLGDAVSSVQVEGDFQKNFSVAINDVVVANYTATPGIPLVLDLSSYDYLFTASDNNISFVSQNSTFAIAGGYVRVTYNESDFDNQVQYLPGIRGFINLYDSFRVPGNLTGLDILLHYNSTYEIFMSIGSTIVYSGNSSGAPITVSLSNATLSSLVNYSFLSENTIPFRVGIVNVSDIYRSSDVFSVSDISGSMNENEVLCGGGNKLLDCAKDANLAFIDTVLNVSTTNVGLVGYQKDAYEPDYHPLSRNESSLDATVAYWSPGGGSCICCGINKAVSSLVNQSGNSLQSIIVMGDGKPNTKCDLEQGTGSASGDAVQAACDAYNDYGIRVYSVGFGSGVVESVMQDIASCGQGDYHFGTVDNLIDVYTTIAEDILAASYDEQVLIGEGSVMTLYPDSHITFNYTTQTPPYGLEIITESADFGNLISEGSIYVPEDAVVTRVGLVSYSGPKWTNLVSVYDNASDLWNPVFNLSMFGDNYTDIGDPYIVNIPASRITQGDNLFRVTTATSPTNVSGGSVYDKIIYTLVKDIAAYSPVLPAAQGCIWYVAFEDGSNTTLLFPSSYNGTQHCYYAPNNYFFPGSNVLLANSQDAISVAILNLFEALDLNGNYYIETKFSESDLDLSSVEIEGLPFTFSTEVQVRTWQ